MIQPADTVGKENRFATLTRSRKYHRCGVCQEYINKGDQYYSIVCMGAGLGSIKFPERAHIECLEKYFERVKRSREL